MLRFILLDTMLFEPGANVEKAREDLLFALEFLTRRSQAYLVDHPNTPTLYRSGVVYERPAQFGGECEEVVTLRNALGPNAKDPFVSTTLDLVQAALGGERFRDVGRIIERGRADCDNVATWRAAELRQNGIKADPYITWKKRSDGGFTYHVIVRWPDGTTEDPSLLLGMGGAGRAADRQKEIEKNADRVRRAQAAAGGNSTPNLSHLMSPANDAGANAAIEELLGSHRGGQKVYVPVDDDGFLNLERELGESWDEGMLRNTGMMRGR
jgi:hypothetical protein